MCLPHAIAGDDGLRRVIESELVEFLGLQVVPQFRGDVGMEGLEDEQISSLKFLVGSLGGHGGVSLGFLFGEVFILFYFCHPTSSELYTHREVDKQL